MWAVGWRIPQFLAGRERELELLRLLPPAGDGQAVVISGEVGIGKSALISAFLDHVRT